VAFVWTERPNAARGLEVLVLRSISGLAQGSGVIEPFRLLRNMLSSQPMCFNLFGPLVYDAALATRLLRVFPKLGVAQVLQVKLRSRRSRAPTISTIAPRSTPS
jgi:hypothetical protein